LAVASQTGTVAVSVRTSVDLHASSTAVVLPTVVAPFHNAAHGAVVAALSLGVKAAVVAVVALEPFHRVLLQIRLRLATRAHTCSDPHGCNNLARNIGTPAAHCAAVCGLVALGPAVAATEAVP
jgi:ascorbate-specific PTS system EIIC-type component UlaA